MYRESAEEDCSVVVVGLNGRVLGLRASDGARLWEHQVSGFFGAGEVELVVHAGRIFACSDGRQVYCFEYPSGRVIGVRSLPGSYTGRPTMLLDDDRLFVCSGGEITCLNMDGQVLWHDPMEGKGVGSMSIAFPDNVRQGDDRGSK